MAVGSLRLDLHVPQARSLKDKRAEIRPLIDGLRNRFHVAAGETEFQDQWQRAVITVAAVSASVRHVTEILDSCERFVWSFPELEVMSSSRGWVED